jgi:hypothetical protein
MGHLIGGQSRAELAEGGDVHAKAQHGGLGG